MTRTSIKIFLARYWYFLIQFRWTDQVFSLRLRLQSCDWLAGGNQGSPHFLLGLNDFFFSLFVLFRWVLPCFFAWPIPRLSSATFVPSALIYTRIRQRQLARRSFRLQLLQDDWLFLQLRDFFMSIKRLLRAFAHVVRNPHHFFCPFLTVVRVHQCHVWFSNACKLLWLCSLTGWLFVCGALSSLRRVSSASISCSSAWFVFLSFSSSNLITFHFSSLARWPSSHSFDDRMYCW